MSMTPADTASRLQAAIDEGLEIFRRVDDTRTADRPRPDAWCAREVLGHLIDSACNNHRRFVTGQSPATTAYDGYDQNEWVRSQRYAESAWGDLVALWTAYNRHLAHVIAVTPVDVVERAATAPNGIDRVTLGFLMDDYVTHLRHHLAQIRDRFT